LNISIAGEKELMDFTFMTKTLSNFGLVLVFVVVAINAYAEDVIKVAISHFPPVKMMVAGKAEGTNIDIMNAFFKKLNIRPIYKQMPFKRCMLSLSKGQSDIIGSLQFSEERSQFLHYIKPAYSEYNLIFYLRKGEEKRLSKYEDLHKLKLGVLRGYKNFEPFDSDLKIRKDEANTWKSNYMKLAAGRIDAIIDDGVEGPYRAHLFDMADKLNVSPYKVNLGRNGFFALSKKSKYVQRAEEFDQVLKAMLDSGEIDKILTDSLKKFK